MLDLTWIIVDLSTIAGSRQSPLPIASYAKVTSVLLASTFPLYDHYLRPNPAHAMTDRTSTKLFIPYPAEASCSLVGILEQLDPRQSTHERSIALVCTWIWSIPAPLVALDMSLTSCRLFRRFYTVLWGQFISISPADWYRVEQKITSFRHKDYLYQKRLARRLPLDSFRFDFRCV